MNIPDKIKKELSSLGYTDNNLKHLNDADNCQMLILSIMEDAKKISEFLEDIIYSQLDIDNCIKIMCEAIENLKAGRKECMKHFKFLKIEEKGEEDGKIYKDASMY